jgi:TolB protein
MPSSIRFKFRVIALVILCGCAAIRAAEAELGEFEAQADVGTVQPAGSGEFDKAGKQYRIKSSGENIWARHDDFHFVYRKATSDMSITADAELIGQGKNAHRKAGLMIREGLEPDAAYVDVMVHGDGLVALQYRSGKGEATLDVKSSIKAPATVRLERHGDAFSAYAAPAAAVKGAEKAADAKKFELIGSIKVAMRDPIYAGLAVTAHDAKVTETALFSNVTVKPLASTSATGKP